MALMPHSGGSTLPVRESRKVPESGVVLVVTSDEIMANRCRDTLHPMGFDVDHVECGVEALKVMRLSAPELVLLDLELRDAHGLDLARWMRSDPALTHIPIIAFTAYAADQRDPRAVENGILTVIRKPVRPNDLNTWIRRAVH